MNKRMQLSLIIILVAISATSLILVFSKKCITYSDKTGNKGGGCFYIWQRGFWSSEGLFDVSVSEVKTFSEIPEFSFQYPVFKGWEVKEIKRDENVYDNGYNKGYNIIFNNPTGKETAVATLAAIVTNNLLVNRFISNQSLDNIPFPKENQLKNKNGVLYAIGERNGVNTLEFYPDNFGVRIILYVLPEFDVKTFFDKIIETFKLSPEENYFTDINATGWFPLSDNVLDFPGKYQEAIVAVIDMLKNKNENPSDYYAQASEVAETNSNIVKIRLYPKEFFIKSKDIIIGSDSYSKSAEIYYNVDTKKIIMEEPTQQ